MQHLTPVLYQTFQGPSFLPGNGGYESGMDGFFVYKSKNGRRFTKWRVFSLDAWGNPRDGFEVNDRRQIGIVYLPEDIVNAPESKIIKALKSLGAIGERMQTRSFHITMDTEFEILIDHKQTTEPLFTMEIV